jgi:hypothetical protein
MPPRITSRQSSFAPPSDDTDAPFAHESVRRYILRCYLQGKLTLDLKSVYE